MDRAERDVKMAARLYECRDAARFILGDKYPATMTLWRDAIVAQMARGQLSVLQATLALCREMTGETEVVTMLIMAAAVELIESPVACDAVGERPTARRASPRVEKSSSSSSVGRVE